MQLAFFKGHLVGLEPLSGAWKGRKVAYCVKWTEAQRMTCSVLKFANIPLPMVISRAATAYGFSIGGVVLDWSYPPPPKNRSREKNDNGRLLWALCVATTPSAAFPFLLAFPVSANSGCLFYLGRLVAFPIMSIFSNSFDESHQIRVPLQLDVNLNIDKACHSPFPSALQLSGGLDRECVAVVINSKSKTWGFEPHEANQFQSIEGEGKRGNLTIPLTYLGQL